MKLGLGSYTFGWAVGVRGHEPARPLDENGLLDKCQELGVKLLQIGDNLPLDTFPRSRLRSLAARAEREGVEIEVGARRLGPEKIAEYVVIARALKAKLLRFVSDDSDYHPTPEQIRETLRQARPALDGLTLGIENHDRLPARTLREIIESVGSEQIGICLDTTNSLGAGEGIDSVLRELGPLAVNLHIKDFHIARVPHLMGFTVEGRPAGQGFLDVAALLKQLASFHRCGTAILELWTPPDSDVQKTIAKESAWAVQSVRYLKPFFTESQP